MVDIGQKFEGRRFYCARNDPISTREPKYHNSGIIVDAWDPDNGLDDIVFELYFTKPDGSPCCRVEIEKHHFERTLNGQVAPIVRRWPDDTIPDYILETQGDDDPPIVVSI